MKGSGVLAGAAAAAALLMLAWGAGLARPPEGVSRGLAVFTAVFPQPLRSAVAEPIPCAPLPRLRFYVVCTSGCDDIWKIVGVRGLRATVLASFNRLPPEAPDERRDRIAAAVAGEGLRLDEAAARAMIACHLRLEGLRPDLVLAPEHLSLLRRTGGDPEAMRRLAESLEDPDPANRLVVTRDDGGFTSTFLYWHTAEAARPVLEMEMRLRSDGSLRDLRAGPARVNEGGG